MEKSFDIQEYMTKGVERILAEALKATRKNPKETAFMLKFASAAAAASKKRALAEKKGEHIPPFLIASITSSCNLHCKGCYARCNKAAADVPSADEMSAAEWSRVFDEAESLGISFILLAGGEPLLRRDVIEAAGERSDIVFPIFSNGTYADEAYLSLFDRCRNLVPMLSIEGAQTATDARRGEGIYEKLLDRMNRFHDAGLLFGASVTVTTENIREVTSDAFVGGLFGKGCRIIIFVEYVPMEEGSKALAPGDEERAYLRDAVGMLRGAFPDMMCISFPGDEKSSGGCIAAGRGFFHVNERGGAEPCPFSPYSDTDVRKTSLKEALQSHLFIALRDGELLKDDHNGGCVLYEKRGEVERLLGASSV